MDRRPVAGLILSIISGIFIILNAVLLSLIYILRLLFFNIRLPLWDKPLSFSTWFLLFLTILGAICGMTILIGAYCLYKGRNILGGLLIIIFSIFSLPIGGGFMIGFILGVTGGVLALTGI